MRQPLIKIASVQAAVQPDGISSANSSPPSPSPNTHSSSRPPRPQSLHANHPLPNTNPNYVKPIDDIDSEEEFHSALGFALDDVNLNTKTIRRHITGGSASSEPGALAPFLSAPELPTVQHVDTIQDLLDETADDSSTIRTVSTRRRSSSKRVRAKRAAKAMSKPIRKGYIGMIAGLASTIGLGQAIFLKATYESPPDARGPRSGVEKPNGEMLSSARGSVTRVSMGGSTAATEKTEAMVSSAIDAAVDGVREELSALDLSPRTEEVNGDVITTRKRILIIGDSLVSGVGGLSSFEDGPSDGPALPRSVARYLSEMLNVDVQWNALSLTGGDVRMLTRKIIPMLTREKEKGGMGDVSAVVVVTGVNDWKRMSPKRTATKFRAELADFIHKIREQVGDDVKIFLPAIPGVNHTPRFHEPLRSIVIFLNDYWDSQKAQLSRTMKSVYFVGQPPSQEWGANPGQFFSTLDRVHPSELGYQRWAERIAEHMVAAFKKGVARVSKSASNASSAMSSATQRASAAAMAAVEQATEVADQTSQDMSSATAAVAAAAGSRGKLGKH